MQTSAYAQRVAAAIISSFAIANTTRRAPIAIAATPSIRIDRGERRHPTRRTNVYVRLDSICILCTRAENALHTLACDCKGLASRCFFDQELFEQTGHGGRCLDCAGNTQVSGKSCQCRQPILCAILRVHTASRVLRTIGDKQTNIIARRASATRSAPKTRNATKTANVSASRASPVSVAIGARTDFMSLERVDASKPTAACVLDKTLFINSRAFRDCHCSIAGSANNEPRCSPHDGACACKANVEGQQCDKCKPGHFNLALENAWGCSPCFCYGHSSVCTSADGFSAFNASSLFEKGLRADNNKLQCNQLAAQRLKMPNHGARRRRRASRMFNGRRSIARSPFRNSTAIQSIFMRRKNISAINALRTMKSSFSRFAFNKPTRHV